jgi:hypothetical protein
MKRVKTDKAQLKAIQVLSISHIRLNFSNYIMGRHAISRRSAVLPALIFPRLRGAGITNKITNISRAETINNYFRLHLDFYLRMLGPSNNTIRPGLPMNILKRVRNDSPSVFHNAVTMQDPDRHLFETDFRPERNISHSYTPDLIDAGIGRGIGTSAGSAYSLLLRGGRSRPGRSLTAMRPSPKAGRNFQDIMLSSHNEVAVIKGLRSALKVIAMTDLTYRGGKLRERDAHKTTTGNLCFQNQRKIEQTVEEIKKIAVETKEKMAGKSASAHSLSEMDIKKHLDINRISDRVYQNIERRIRIERERRGM